ARADRRHGGRGSDAAARWGRTPLAERVETLKDLARELRSASPRLCGLVVEEMGKPVAEARAEVEKSAVTADHYAAAAPRSSPTSRSRSVTLVPGWPTSRSDSCSR
ncbi:MAG: aldehyde dehydrogenase family protein, partial [Actinobacteria bacterium]|nr:aldehyde dehydrogenase family protein [Actinomycetota bacterium]